MTTDSFVVKPLRFPGGSIGELAINGTVNDLAMAGARPVAITVALILEEGLDAAVLRAEVEAIATAAAAAGVEVIAGDTKVVERGHCDWMYMTTTGIGAGRSARFAVAVGAHPGDRMVVSGPIGDHGTAIMLARDEFDLDADIESDTQLALAGRRRPARRRGDGAALHARRDPRRRRHRAQRARARVRGRDRHPRGRRPGPPEVAGAAEILGIDPMYVANEGRMVAFVAPDAADEAIAALRAIPGSEEAAEIGEVRTEPPGMVLVETAFGGKRVMDLLAGDPLPRIC